MNKTKTFAAAVFALLLVAACGSSGIGDILNGGGGSTAGVASIHGTVDSVDTNSRSIYLTNVSGYNNSLRDSSNYNSVRVYYNNNTSINYQGRNYRPEDLERGDEVTIRVDQQSGGQLVAESMDVTYNNRGGMASSSNGTYGSYPSNTYPNTYPNGTYGNNNGYSTLRGTVSYVDTANRTIELTSTSWMSGFQGNNTGSRVVVSYDPNGGVDWNGRSYPVTNLERGDVVDVQVANNNSSSNWFANRITLVRDVNNR